MQKFLFFLISCCGVSISQAGTGCTQSQIAVCYADCQLEGLPLSPNSYCSVSGTDGNGDNLNCECGQQYSQYQAKNAESCGNNQIDVCDTIGDGYGYTLQKDNYCVLATPGSTGYSGEIIGCAYNNNHIIGVYSPNSNFQSSVDYTTYSYTIPS